MPFHLAAWSQSVQQAGAFVSINAVADPVLTILGVNIQVPTLDHIIGLAAGVETAAAQQARLTGPSRRVLVLERIAPTQGNAAAASLPGDPHKWSDRRHDPLQLVRGEQLTMDLLATPAAPQIQWGLAWFADKEVVEAPPGALFTARATAATACVAQAWTNMAIVFAEALPRGRYQVLGFRAQSANAVAARLVFVGGVGGGAWRPGVLATNTDRHLENVNFRYGGMGLFGEFEDTDPPTVDMLATAADAAEVFYLDLLQVRSGPA
jgi:hypothetical protein